MSKVPSKLKHPDIPRPLRSGVIQTTGKTTVRKQTCLLDTVAVGTGSGTLTSEGTTQVEGSVHGDHLGQDLKTLLGNGLVVDGDQVLGLGVDLEGLVEGKSSLDVVGA